MTSEWTPPVRAKQHCRRELTAPRSLRPCRKIWGFSSLDWEKVGQFIFFEHM